jgi:hypothetical protein
MSSAFLDRESTIAPPGYNRFLFPPAALAVHLCIGQAYAFSTFNLPLTKLLGITQSTPSDWKLTDVGRRSHPARLGRDEDAAKRAQVVQLTMEYTRP